MKINHQVKKPEAKKTENINFKVTASERAALIEAAERYGVDVSVLIRKLIFQTKGVKNAD